MIQAMKVDFFQHRIFAVTPRGDVIDLPVESTPVDFAYHIHSDVGDTCVGAKVNGALVPLDHKLKSGDIVQILTQKGKKPSEDWLRFAKTTIARDHIRMALRGKKKLMQRPQRTDPLRTQTGHPEPRRAHQGYLRHDCAEPREHFKLPLRRPERQSLFVRQSGYPASDKAKIEKLILKLKTVSGVKEISYQLV